MTVITERCNIVNKSTVYILDVSHLGPVKHNINPFFSKLRRANNRPV